jgi:hypothetical protein
VAEDHSYQAMERLLRSGASVGGRAGAGALCIDGETLAAWSSGVLAPADAARVETHLADCDRCQSMLAAFARVEPVAVAPPGLVDRSFSVRRLARRSFSGGGWLVPLATAATVAAIWVAIPQRNEPAETFIAESRETLPPQPPAARSEPAPEQPAPTFRDQTASSPTAQSAQPKREADAAQKRTEKGKEEAAAQQYATRGAGAAADTLADDRFGAAAARRAPPPSAAAPAAPPAAESLAVAPETRQLLARSAGADFASPDGTTRWRIAGGQVQRSTTQGRVWEVVTLPSPATVTAGHSPAPSVTWVVGSAGAIFVTTDGVRFERVPFPHAVDLAAILAVDDRQATVTTVDGRVFGTSDRGVSWISP